MIATLAGTIQAVEVGSIIVQVAGVGYRVLLSLRDMARCSEGQAVQLYTHHHVREDAQILYGFLDVHDLRVFEQLIQVSGVGPKIAQAILSEMSGAEVIDALLTRNATALTRISGVGKKTAERLMLELQDRLDRLSAGTLERKTQRTVENDARDDLFQALKALGYRSEEIESVVPQVDSALPLGEQVRLSLQLLSGGSTYAR